MSTNVQAQTHTYFYVCLWYIPLPISNIWLYRPVLFFSGLLLLPQLIAELSAMFFFGNAAKQSSAWIAATGHAESDKRENGKTENDKWKQKENTRRTRNSSAICGTQNLLNIICIQFVASWQAQLLYNIHHLSHWPCPTVVRTVLGRRRQVARWVAQLICICPKQKYVGNTQAAITSSGV